MEISKSTNTGFLLIICLLHFEINYICLLCVRINVVCTELLFWRLFGQCLHIIRKYGTIGINAPHTPHINPFTRGSTVSTLCPLENYNFSYFSICVLLVNRN
jgi:hypothetical protein